MRENRLVETAIKSLKDVLREQEDAVKKNDGSQKADCGEFLPAHVLEER